LNRIYNLHNQTIAAQISANNSGAIRSVNFCYPKFTSPKTVRLKAACIAMQGKRELLLILTKRGAVEIDIREKISTQCACVNTVK
jgi:hypothetical protein